ncbi:MAG: hypothetical protein ACRDBG_11125 [Waterburya sp.]
MKSRIKERNRTKDEQIALWRQFNNGVTYAESLGLSRDFNGFSQLKNLCPKVYREAKQALDTLVWSTQGIVAKQANYYSGYCFDLQELMQIGNAGVVYAAWKYNPDRPVESGKSIAKFTSYAYFWIRASIVNAISKDRMIYVPHTQKDTKYLYSFIPSEIMSEGVIDDVSTDDTKLVDSILLALDTQFEIDCICAYFGISGATLRTFCREYQMKQSEAVSTANSLILKIKEKLNISH